ncbi:hypothetical protein N7510_006697 [Penicillium lagena]|uniref:uncharacterized protein n=1 Tax=Penicillium lagena TaxID=94218 RepID=UPI002541FD61|nr:uncharacterized protein N7510_006697 [Penicillium lagena]KAJ5609978.1 hypothetical protein N7510_006697 [Penicillium lagena]
MVRKFLGLDGTKLQIAIGLLAGMDFLLFGYDQGVTGGLLTLASFNSVFPSIQTSGMIMHDGKLTSWDNLPPSDEAVRRASFLNQQNKKSHETHRENAEKDSENTSE